MGVPFVPVRGLFGSDLLRTRSDWKVIPHPFNPDEEIVVCPALNPTVALFHATVADHQGNCIVPGRQEAMPMARAADAVIVTAEEVVEGPLSPRDGEGTFIPGIYITAVVHTPYGAHPTGVKGLYDPDLAHIRLYAQMAKEGRFREYLERYVYGVRNGEDYQALVGIGARA
ncbi:Glutaconate CoA-transferase subunit A [bacterium HR23]|nr:Glutaconate CoA-transferase subunit A [bacterium HR23]